MTLTHFQKKTNHIKFDYKSLNPTGEKANKINCNSETKTLKYLSDLNCLSSFRKKAFFSSGFCLFNFNEQTLY